MTSQVNGRLEMKKVKYHFKEYLRLGNKYGDLDKLKELLK